MDELRRSFHDRIASLHGDTLAMVDDAVDALGNVTAAFVGRDLGARPVPPADERVKAIEAEVVDLLAQQGPVARDLRLILASLHIAGAAGLCLGLCRTLDGRAPRVMPALTPAMEALIAQIGDATCELLRAANRAWRVVDEQMAVTVVSSADPARHLQRAFLTELLQSRDMPVDAAVDLGLASRAYERLTDHAVDIAGRVVFVATGSPLPGTGA